LKLIRGEEMAPTPTTKKAMAAIHYFEQQGREVIGVAIKGTEFKLDFAKTDKDQTSDVDLVDMGR
jgi:uncharacterized protein YkuJ